MIAKCQHAIQDWTHYAKQGKLYLLELNRQRWAPRLVGFLFFLKISVSILLMLYFEKYFLLLMEDLD